jgi:uncharacterized protein (TIGR02147 family)
MWEKEFSKALREHFASLQKKNPRFSLRAFSKKMGISAGSLSDILSQKKKWQLSATRAAKLLDKLELDPRVKNRLRIKMGEAPVHIVKPLSNDQFEILLDWRFFPILYSFDLHEKLGKPKAIAERLGIEVEEVEQIIEALLRRKFLEKGPDGRIRLPENYLHTTEEIPLHVVEQAHLAGLECAGKALRELPPERRDFTTVTFAGSEKQMKELGREIRKLHQKAMVPLDDPEEYGTVMRLSVQLFPMDFRKK